MSEYFVIRDLRTDLYLKRGEFQREWKWVKNIDEAEPFRKYETAQNMINTDKEHYDDDDEDILMIFVKGSGDKFSIVKVNEI